MKGYKDKFNIDTEAILELITALEARAHDSTAEANKAIHEIREAAKDTTHMWVYSLRLYVRY